jgi:hypothetical protein
MADPIVRYQPPNSAQWLRLATNPVLRSSLMQVGQKGRATAVGLSAGFADTGTYSRSFRVTSEVAPFGRYRARRVVVTLSNPVPYAAAVEMRHKVLSRTRDLLRVT